MVSTTEQAQTLRRTIHHRFTADQARIVAKELAPTIAEYLATKTRWGRHDRSDLPKLIPIIQGQSCVDPDADFAQHPATAINNTTNNIELLAAQMALMRRRAVSADWNYDVATHAQLIAAHAAEMLIRQWMERAITIRALICDARLSA